MNNPVRDSLFAFRQQHRGDDLAKSEPRMAKSKPLLSSEICRECGA